MDLAEFLLASWEGATLRMKVERGRARTRPLQEHCLPNCIQGAEMTVHSDVVLPQANVQGSTMAYREAGGPEESVALFCAGIQASHTYGGILFRWFRR
jgi:hypothetical protein